MKALPKNLKEHTRAEALQKIGAIMSKLENKQAPSQEERYFIHQVLDAVEHIFIAEIRERQARLDALQTSDFGHVAVWGGKLTPGCQHCVDHGFAPIRSASNCNLNCSFCYYGEDQPHVTLLGDDQFEIENRPVTARELKVMLTKGVKGPGVLESVAWVFLEPFMALDKHPEMIAFVHELGLYQHMYTNGTLCTRQNMKLLADAGLDEMRFNLAATKCADNVIEAMGEARDLFPYLCVESPMYPEYFEHFMQKREAILATGVSHIHCAEMHLTPENFQKHRHEDIYQYSRGYISPMSSRRLTYDLMDVAAKEGWKDVAIHDCSNEVKFLRGVSVDKLGIICYEQELPGMPMWWFPKALQNYPLTADA